MAVAGYAVTQQPATDRCTGPDVEGGLYAPTLTTLAPGTLSVDWMLVNSSIQPQWVRVGRFTTLTDRPAISDVGRVLPPVHH